MCTLTLGREDRCNRLRFTVSRFPQCCIYTCVCVMGRQQYWGKKKKTFVDQKSDMSSSRFGSEQRPIQPLFNCSKEKGRTLSSSLSCLTDSSELTDSRCSRQLLSAISPADRFTMINLTDAYFHVAIHPEDHQQFLRFAFKGKAYKYLVLPFGQSLAPCTFTKCVEAALAPIWVIGLYLKALVSGQLPSCHKH